MKYVVVSGSVRHESATLAEALKLAESLGLQRFAVVRTRVRQNHETN